MTAAIYLNFDEMTWPNPEDPADVEWALRYGTPTPAQLNIAGSVIAAYKQLIEDTTRRRNEKITGIRNAMKETTG